MAQYEKLSSEIIKSFLEQSGKTVVKCPIDYGVQLRLSSQEIVDCYYTKEFVVKGKGNHDSLANQLSQLNDFLQNPPKIFIDYAFKNNAMKESVKKIIKELGFEPLVMEERENNTRSLLRKLENLIYQADYGVVLLSADDKLVEGGFHTRPNIMIELGMLLAHLKDKGEHRVTLINCAADDLAIPSDILGTAYITYNCNDSYEKLKEQLTKELAHLYPRFD